MNDKREPKPGEGALFPNTQARDERHPTHKGYAVLKDRSVLGVAAWQKAKGVISIKLDERETAYWAKRLGLRPAIEPEPEQSSGERYRQNFGKDMTPRERAGFGSGPERTPDNHGKNRAASQAEPWPDEEDDFPF